MTLNTSQHLAVSHHALQGCAGFVGLNTAHPSAELSSPSKAAVWSRALGGVGFCAEFGEKLFWGR